MLIAPNLALIRLQARTGECMCLIARKRESERANERERGVLLMTALQNRDRLREREQEKTPGQCVCLGCYQNLRNLKSIHQTQRLQLIFSVRDR